MRHVPEEDKSAWAKKRDRPNRLVPFNVFAVQEDITALNQMASELGYGSRAEMLRVWMHDKLKAHAEAKAASKPVRRRKPAVAQ